MHQNTAHIFSSHNGRKARNAFLARSDWQCAMCGALLTKGRTHARSAVVDHIKPAALCPELEWVEANWWLVCKACHDGPCETIERQHAGNADAIAQAKRDYKPMFNADGSLNW